ncbi:unnamed protein product [Clavelina lepadiformis]|uniref:Secreted protein n=1 Tax=Clavelina lepadiformis TaxID=159417 RepID=A0ABP0H0L0_CLALP
MKIYCFVCLPLIFIYLETVELTNGSAAGDDMSRLKVERASRQRRNLWQFGIVIQYVQNIESPFPWWALIHLRDYGYFSGCSGQ